MNGGPSERRRADDPLSPTRIMRPSLPIVVRTIALVEAAKGALALVAGVGLLGLVHRDVSAVAEQFVRFGHEDVVRHKLVQRIVAAYNEHQQQLAPELRPRKRA